MEKCHYQVAICLTISNPIKMRKPVLIILFFVALFFGIRFLIHTDAKNYKNAYLIVQNDTVFIKTKGKSVLMNHEFWSCNSKTYEDSALFQIPKSIDGRIEGNELPSEPGDYKCSGFIDINKNKLVVNLFFENTDDNRIEPSRWNGKYNLIR